VEVFDEKWKGMVPCFAQVSGKVSFKGIMSNLNSGHVWELKKKPEWRQAFQRLLSGISYFCLADTAKSRYQSRTCQIKSEYEAIFCKTIS
jgi:hypothetical protein